MCCDRARRKTYDRAGRQRATIAMVVVMMMATMAPPVTTAISHFGQRARLIGAR
jgi:hypothetical protein